MENATFVALSRQVGIETKMGVVAQNIANINTPGYRAQNVVFNEYLVEESGDYRDLSQSLNYGDYMSTAPGSIRQTGNPLDVALEGKGYFGVQSPDGQAYTRNGRFSLNANREIITAAGFPVTDEGGNPITIPPSATEIRISEDGSVSTNEGIVTRLKIVEFANDQELIPAGNGLYRTTLAEQPSPDTRAVQGAYEGSNVQGVLEMTRMIDTSREFQSLQRLLQGEHERQRTMIQRLTRTN